jgi:hypothetical protein
LSDSRFGKAAVLGVGLGLVAIVISVSREEPLPRAVSGVKPSSSNVELSPSPVEDRVSPVEARPPNPAATERATISVVSAQPKPPEAEQNTEAHVMAKLRELQGSDPLLSLTLAREANQRFPDSPDAPERAWFEARALVDLQRFAEAQQLARDMGDRYPRTSWTDDVQRHLLTHPLGLPPAQ